MACEEQEQEEECPSPLRTQETSGRVRSRFRAVGSRSSCLLWPGVWSGTRKTGALLSALQGRGEWVVVSCLLGVLCCVYDVFVLCDVFV
jgi:hypothetical protein